MADTHEDYLRRQRERIKHLRLSPEVYARVRQYAKINGLSNSEAIREVMAKYVAGLPVTGRQSRSRRVSLWIEPQDYKAFTDEAHKNGLSIVGALEAALEEVV